MARPFGITERYQPVADGGNLGGNAGSAGQVGTGLFAALLQAELAS